MFLNANDTTNTFVCIGSVAIYDSQFKHSIIRAYESIQDSYDYAIVNRKSGNLTANNVSISQFDVGIHTYGRVSVSNSTFDSNFVHIWAVDSESYVYLTHIIIISMSDQQRIERVNLYSELSLTNMGGIIIDETTAVMDNSLFQGNQTQLLTTVLSQFVCVCVCVRF